MSFLSWSSLMVIPNAWSCENCESLHNVAGWPALYWVRKVKLLTQHVVRGNFWVLTNGSPPCWWWSYRPVISIYNWLEMGYHFPPSLIQLRLRHEFRKSFYAVSPFRGRGGATTTTTTTLTAICSQVVRMHLDLFWMAHTSSSYCWSYLTARVQPKSHFCWIDKVLDLWIFAINSMFLWVLFLWVISTFLLHCFFWSTLYISNINAFTVFPRYFAVQVSRLQCIAVLFLIGCVSHRWLPAHNHAILVHLVNCVSCILNCKCCTVHYLWLQYCTVNPYNDT